MEKDALQEAGVRTYSEQPHKLTHEEMADVNACQVQGPKRVKRARELALEAHVSIMELRLVESERARGIAEHQLFQATRHEPTDKERLITAQNALAVSERDRQCLEGRVEELSLKLRKAGGFAPRMTIWQKLKNLLS